MQPCLAKKGRSVLQGVRLPRLMLFNLRHTLANVFALAPCYGQPICQMCDFVAWQVMFAHIHVQYSQPPRTEDTISYNACITACERGGRWQEALACLHAHHSVHSFHENRDLTRLAVKAMSARSISINTVSYNAVSWFAYAQNWGFLCMASGLAV